MDNIDYEKILAEGDESALEIQKSIRGREGRKNEEMLKQRAAAQRQHEEASNVEIRGLSRGRKGRNSVSDARSQELAAIRIQSIQRGRLGRHRVAQQTGTASLTSGMIRKGLRTHGRHPILLKHAFLQLELPNNGLKSIDAITDYPHVMYLNLSNNSIEDLSPLSSLSTLIELNANHNSLTTCLDFSPPLCTTNNSWSTGSTSLGSLLVNVDLSYNLIDDMYDTIYQYHPFLEVLLLAHNSIPVIKGLQTLQYLQVLDLSYNNITYISGLDSLPLRELNLTGNSIQTLHGIENIPSLQVLSIGYNKISCLAPLKYCVNLTYLNIQNNNITIIRQIEYLKNLSWLQTLIMIDNAASHKPFYRFIVIHILKMLAFLDRTAVSTEEKIRSANLFEDEEGDTEMRIKVFEKFFPNERFKNYSPSFYNKELDINLRELEFQDQELEKQLRSQRLNKSKEMMDFVLTEAKHHVLMKKLGKYYTDDL